MENNSVHLIGTVKRNAEAGSGVIDFAIEVENRKGRREIFDCRTTSHSAAYHTLEGFVNEGEPIELVGHLEKRTFTETQRVAGVKVDVTHTVVLVYVDDILSTEDMEEQE